MKHTHPTCEHDTRPRTSRRWVIHWANIEPTIRRYQTPVLMSRVLSEHHGAIAAQPIDEVARDHLPAIDLDDLDVIDLDALEQFDLDALPAIDLDELNRLLDEKP